MIGIGGLTKSNVKYVILAYSEDSFKGQEDHGDGDTVGYCGAKRSIWGDYLEERNIPINSLKACVAIFDYYLEQEGSTAKALKEYKGIESKEKMWIVHKVVRNTEKIKEIVE